MKLKTKLVAFIATTAALVTGTASAAVGGVDVSGVAGTFQTDFVAAAAVIGTAMIAAAFGAIIYKWIKAMVFGG